MGGGGRGQRTRRRSRAQREYLVRPKQGRIPIIPDDAGNNCILVDVREHPDPMAERLRRQITEGGIIQAAGRARAGLRKADEPLDIHLWTDVPAPELGPVEPVLWGDLGAGPDGVMLVGGVWLECLHDAARAYNDLVTVEGLKSAREGRGGGVGVLDIGLPICRTPAPRLICYQRAGKGLRPQRALALMEPAAARAWLEEKLGPLVRFEVVERGEKDEAV